MDKFVQQASVDSMVKEDHLGKADTGELLGPKEEALKCIDPLKQVHRSCEFKLSAANFVILMALTI